MRCTPDEAKRIQRSLLIISILLQSPEASCPQNDKGDPEEAAQFGEGNEEMATGHFGSSGSGERGGGARCRGCGCGCS
jgi:hypothetical protein